MHEAIDSSRPTGAAWKLCVEGGLGGGEVR